MRTVGVDLAAEPKRTGLAVVEWSAGRAVVTSLTVGASDDAIVAVAAGATRMGIDAPFGWPEPFIGFVTAHRDGKPLAASDLAGRKHLAYRLTDQLVVAAGQGRPLSVSADLIGHAAMRAAGLLAALGAAGYDVDRTGAGLVAETYPAAALRRWNLVATQYKGGLGAARRTEIVDGLLASLPGLDLGEHDALCRQTDDALDAVICALIARAVELGAVTVPTDAQRSRATTEGWIMIPTCELQELLD